MAKGSDHLQEYIGDIRRQLATGVAAEHAYRPALKRLLEAHRTRIVAVNDPRREKCGAPDFIVQKGKVRLGYLECKDIGTDLAKVLKTEQLERYLESLGNLILTDYLEFRWFVGGELRLSARIATVNAKGKVKADPAGEAQLIELLDGFYDADVPIITSSKQLAQRMAKLAQLMRDIIAKAFEHEPDAGTLHEQMAGFRDVLLHDLTLPQFADMYAQTICYGLFAARIHTKEPTKFNREHAAWDLPATNPFLREMFSHIAGPSLDTRIVWAVDDLAELLRAADIHAILADFGKATRRDDPVVHFYETFLAAYDRKMRKSRGVYYTPEPVVSYIVRSIDHILKADFGLPDGLADATKINHTFTDPMTGKKEEREVHKVQILDPATGTGTFLHGVIAAVHEKFAGNEGAWDGYVSEHLLPRLFGFELLMAPYAVAHMKLGLQLRETGYKFASDERLNVFLTNTLEEAEHHAAGLFAGLIAKEANEASRVKRDTPVMVVLGNPPYSNFGQMNRNEWILGLLDDYKKGLKEKKLNIDDDFIKFFKFAQHRIEQTGYGILAFISNNTYIDGITHRRMRESLMETFDDIYILNLHGDTRKGEVCPDGSPDENVFDIQQGVAIGLFVKRPGAAPGHAPVRYAELWGSRSAKYESLEGLDIVNTEWGTVQAATMQSCLGNFHFFAPKDFANVAEYCCGWGLPEISSGISGIETKRDNFAIDWNPDALRKRIADFVDGDYSDAERKDKFGVRDNEWVVAEGVQALREDRTWESSIVPCVHRAFDRRWIVYSPVILARDRGRLMAGMVGDNVGLVAPRQTKEEFGVLAIDTVCTHKIVTLYDRSFLFPLYLYPDVECKKGKVLLEASPWPAGPGGRRPNLSPEFVAEFGGKVGLEFVPDGCGDLTGTFGPEDVFHYIYAVFHCPTYRSRYAEFLKIDFPRLPLTSDVKLFGRLCGLGAELVGLHLLAAVPAPAVNFPARGDNTVEKVRYVDTQRRVYINDEQYFEPVAADVWEFHVGGYQVCEKWLKDRKGRELSYDDITHYRKVVTALGETIRLMGEIDAAIPSWPIE